ncbi:MAG TPA: alpha/beta hydrolase [Bacteroidia bacterium]|nr:alpha/beta hydrolase [Bacteroidia bacterium]HNP99068.1 alpha/beta hydrolase [Bacteroidia bacterium]
MSFNKFYYLLSALLVFFAAFIYLSPGFIAPDFIYPERIDSLYVSFHSPSSFPDSEQTDAGDFSEEHYNPSDFAIDYSVFNVNMKTGGQLRGWYIAAEDTPANTILLIHDLNESKINYLDHIKQLHDRGFNVCVMDLRAHGNSDGTEFSPGEPEIEDMKLVMDTLLSNRETHHLILMGKGIGAAIATQAALFDGRCDVLILESPILNLSTYLDRYAYRKWSFLKAFWYPVFRRKVESLMEFPIRDLDLRNLVKYIKTPTLFVAVPDNELVFTTEILSIYENSVATRKELFLLNQGDKVDIPGGEVYYNRISEFINGAIPKKIKKTKYKKLALHDQ